MKKRIGLILVMALTVMVFAACSGGGSAGNTISTTATDFHFEPSTWTVKAGEQVTLEITNDGAVEHDWVLLGSMITAPADGEKDVIFETEVAPGQTESVTFTAPATPGEYQVICEIAGHLEAGMEGKLVVTE
jgi:plastocyanin